MAAIGGGPTLREMARSRDTPSFAFSDGRNANNPGAAPQGRDSSEPRIFEILPQEPPQEEEEPQKTFLVRLRTENPRLYHNLLLVSAVIILIIIVVVVYQLIPKSPCTKSPTSPYGGPLELSLRSDRGIVIDLSFTRDSSVKEGNIVTFSDTDQRLSPTLVNALRVFFDREGVLNVGVVTGSLSTTASFEEWTRTPTDVSCRAGIRIQNGVALLSLKPDGRPDVVNAVPFIFRNDLITHFVLYSDAKFGGKSLRYHSLNVGEPRPPFLMVEECWK